MTRRTAAPSTLYLVKQLELSIRAQLDALLRPAGVTALQYTALSVLARRPDMSAAELARRSFVRPQSVSDLVAGLDRHGFIERSADPANRRILLMRLTPRGEEFLAQHAPRVADIEERMLADMTARERSTLREWLASCLQRLD